MTTVSSLKTVYIYSGHRVFNYVNGKTLWQMHGPYAESVAKHATLFNHLNARRVVQWNIRQIYGDELIATLKDADPKSSLIVIPAGESTNLDKAFTDEEIEEIKVILREGASLFCTCGSAYWISQKRIWNDKSAKKSRIAIFDGIAEGPLAPYSGQTTTHFLHEVVKVKNTVSKIHLLISGGGSLIPTEDSKQKIEIIGSYSRKDLKRFEKENTWSNCVIKCSFGKGKAILSMVHPDYGADDICAQEYQRAFPERDDDWQRIHDTLSSDEDRMTFVNHILSELEIPFTS